MSMMLIGIIITAVLVGIVGASIYSAYSGSVSILRVAGVGSIAGTLGSVTTIFSDAWQFIVASAWGELGWSGYLLIGGLLACLSVWGYNAYTDARKNRPIAPVK